MSNYFGEDEITQRYNTVPLEDNLIHHEICGATAYDSIKALVGDARQAAMLGDSYLLRDCRMQLQSLLELVESGLIAIAKEENK